VFAFSSPPIQRTRARGATLGILAAMLVAPLSFSAAAPALAEPVTPPTGTTEDYSTAQPDDLIDVRIGDVRPTQPSVGYDEIYYKLGRYDAALGKDAINKRFGDWCEANGQLDVASAQPGATLHDPATFECEVAVGAETKKSIAAMKTVVIGPGGTPYLTDGHHTLTSLAETPDGGQDLHVRLRVVANLSDLAPEAFWQRMIEHKWTWLEQADGTPITPAQLPTSVALRNFGNDENRSLLYFARDIGFAAGTIPFQEFYWGAWLRESNPAYLATWDKNDAASYLAAVRALSEQQVALPKQGVVYGGFTATELGALDAWNDGKKEGKGEWAKLSAPYSEAKPGKIAYAMAYKATLPEPETPGTGGEGPGEGPGNGGTEQPTDPATIRGTLSTSGTPVAGGTITVNGTGFAPSVTGFSLELHSEPVPLATVASDANGAFSVTVTLPAGINGAHALVLLYQGTELATQQVRIAQAPAKETAGEQSPAQPKQAAKELARTGGEPAVPLIAGASLLALAGAALVAATQLRRRKA